jgi:hypothetical protein
MQLSCIFEKKITYHNSPVVLLGSDHTQFEEVLIHISQVSHPVITSAAPALLPEISALLHKFAVVFSAPVALPPVRSCDHSIPLVAGAQPVNIRPYRYPPSLKDEIEKQVSE